MRPAALAGHQSLVGQELGKYRLTEVLGRGGMGVVYLAEHRVLGSTVAIKLITPEIASYPDMVGRFFNEARAASRLKHPGIVDIYDYDDQDPERTYLVMEHLAGESLRACLDRNEPMAMTEAVEIIGRIAAPLGAVHGQGIVHRDLKPDNIFLLPDPDHPEVPRVKLIDFGVAKVLEHHAGASWQTSSGALLGTPHYMSPEQCHGARAIDQRADIYALGVIAFELFTGRLPFTGQGLGQLLQQQLTQAPPSMRATRPGIPPALEAQVMRALAKDPAERFERAGDFSAALRAAIEDMREETLPPGRAQPEQAPPQASTPAADRPAASMPEGSIPPTRIGPRSTAGRVLLRNLMLSIFAFVTLGVLALVMLRSDPGTTRPGARDAGSPAAGSAAARDAALKPSPPGQGTADPLSDVAMVQVPTGSLPGATGGAPEPPERPSQVAAFELDRSEVTVAQYRRCVREGGCDEVNLTGTEVPGQAAFRQDPACNWARPGQELHPMNCVNWRQAVAFCRWAKKELPSEAQWERAARGSEGRLFPWGAEKPTCRLAVIKAPNEGCGEGGTWPTGSRSPGGDSPFGIQDMLGNVAEWMRDAYQSEGGQNRPAGGAATQAPRRAVRGGSWINEPQELQLSGRTGYPPGFRLNDLGFRCARSAKN